MTTEDLDSQIHNLEIKIWRQSIENGPRVFVHLLSFIRKKYFSLGFIFGTMLTGIALFAIRRWV